MDFIESTASASSESNCTISEFHGDRTGSRNRNGQGRGKATTYGGHGGGVGELGVKRKWLQEDVDVCNHLTEQRYSKKIYEKFSPVE